MSTTRSYRRLILELWLTLGLTLVLGGHVLAETSWDETYTLIGSRFPTVRQLSTEELAELLEVASSNRPVVLDVREPEEFEVSHLQDAYLATNLAMALERLREVEPARTIIVYCAVGYRSSRLAAELEKRGYVEVFNLEGSLFKWANEGRAVFRGNVRVDLVHPYDEEWGQLLDRKFWPESF